MIHVLVRLVLVADPLRSVSRVLSTEVVVSPISDGSWPRHVCGEYGEKIRMRSQGCVIERPCFAGADALPFSSLLAGKALSRVGRPVGNLTLRL
jgi:hypothetical protein